jgi:hypothetical protein
MIKNTMNLLAVIALISTVSCKQDDGLGKIIIDQNTGLIVAEGKAAEIRKTLKSEEYPKIEIENPNFDFGTITEGDKVEHIFKFKNTGKNDLYVIDVKPSCGCTSPEWTKTPVKKGASGEIKIVFNSTGKNGAQNKTINLLTNTEAGNELLTFKANIVAKTETSKN